MFERELACFSKESLVQSRPQRTSPRRCRLPRSRACPRSRHRLRLSRWGMPDAPVRTSSITTMVMSGIIILRMTALDRPLCTPVWALLRISTMALASSMVSGVTCMPTVNWSMFRGPYLDLLPILIRTMMIQTRILFLLHLHRAVAFYVRIPPLLSNGDREERGHWTTRIFRRKPQKRHARCQLTCSKSAHFVPAGVV